MTPTEWLIGEDTGISSKTIYSVMVGCEFGRSDVPHDPDDFGRCFRLLKLFPVWEFRLQEVADKHREWGPFVEVWDELSSLYRKCSEQDGRYTQSSYKLGEAYASALFERMQGLVDRGREISGWVQTAPGCWRKEAKEITHVIER